MSIFFSRLTNGHRTTSWFPIPDVEESISAINGGVFDTRLFLHASVSSWNTIKQRFRPKSRTFMGYFISKQLLPKNTSPVVHFCFAWFHTKSKTKMKMGNLEINRVYKLWKAWDWISKTSIGRRIYFDPTKCNEWAFSGSFNSVRKTKCGKLEFSKIPCASVCCVYSFGNQAAQK